MEGPKVTISVSEGGVGRVVVGISEDAGPGLALLGRLLPGLRVLDESARQAVKKPDR